MKRIRLDISEYVVRDIRPREIFDDNGRPSVFPQAFHLRLKEDYPHRTEDETYLSALWREYFSGTENEILANCIDTLGKSGRKLSRNAALVICNVGKLEECGARFKTDIQAWREPKSWNEAYAAIRGMRPEHQKSGDLPTAFAEYAVTSVTLVRDID